MGILNKIIRHKTYDGIVARIKQILLGEESVHIRIATPIKGLNSNRKCTQAHSGQL